MLRLIIAAVLASACLAYPQRREGAPQDAANLQSFADPAMQAMQAGMPNMQGMQGLGLQGMQPMQPMAGGQFMPFAGNFGMGYKRDLDEELEKRRQSQFSNLDNNMVPFDGFENLMNFGKENDNSRPFASMEGDATDMGNFQPMDKNEDGKYRFFENNKQ